MVCLDKESQTKYLQLSYCRSSHLRCSVKRLFWNISRNSQENTHIGVSFLIILKELRHKCCPLNFTNFLGTPFFIEHLRCLLLSLSKFLTSIHLLKLYCVDDLLIRCFWRELISLTYVRFTSSVWLVGFDVGDFNTLDLRERKQATRLQT